MATMTSRYGMRRASALGEPGVTSNTRWPKRTRGASRPGVLPMRGGRRGGSRANTPNVLGAGPISRLQLIVKLRGAPPLLSSLHMHTLHIGHDCDFPSILHTLYRFSIVIFCVYCVASHCCGAAAMVTEVRVRQCARVCFHDIVGTRRRRGGDTNRRNLTRKVGKHKDCTWAATRSPHSLALYKRQGGGAVGVGGGVQY